MKAIAIVLIERSDGALFVHRRRDDKWVFPGLHGLGAGGRIEPGETPAQGAQRELLEETGLEAPVRPITHFVFDNEGVRYQVHLFHVQAQGPIQNHDAEWSSSGFRSQAQVDALLAAGELCPDTAECYRRAYGRPLADR